MNRNLASAIVIAAAAFTGTAFADTFAAEQAPIAAGSATRATVQSQLAQFKGAGTSVWSYAYNPLASFQGGKTREQVRAEFKASRAEAAAFNAQDSGSFYLSRNAARPVAAGTNLAGSPVNAQ